MRAAGAQEAVEPRGDRAIASASRPSTPSAPRSRARCRWCRASARSPGSSRTRSEHYREAALSARSTSSRPRPAGCSLHLDNNVNTAASLIAGDAREARPVAAQDGVAPTRTELEAALRAERARILAHARALHPKASLEFAAAALTQELHLALARQPGPARAADRAAAPGARNAAAHAERALHDEQWETLGAILELLPLAAAHLKVVFAEHGETDFTEIAQAAVRALGTPDEPDRPPARARHAHQAHPGRRVPGHLVLAVRIARETHRRAGSPTTAARCSSSATRCSRSTASARPRSRSSSRPGSRASAA